MTYFRSVLTAGEACAAECGILLGAWTDQACLLEDTGGRRLLSFVGPYW